MNTFLKVTYLVHDNIETALDYSLFIFAMLDLLKISLLHTNLFHPFLSLSLNTWINFKDLLQLLRETVKIAGR